MTVFRHVRVVPLLILVSSLSFAVRMGEVVYGFHGAGAAFAKGDAPTPQDAAGAQPPPFPAPAAASDSVSVPAPAEAPPPGNPGASSGQKEVPSPPAAGKGEKVEWKDATETELDYSPVKEDMYKELKKRREDLDKRERVIATREALLEAAERELDQKTRELLKVRDEIGALLKQQSAEEEARVKSLVTIYEGMKPKDAARIFNTLDMDVLISVVAKMSERKLSPIMAEMTPDRARAVTILLAQQNQLPALPPQ